MPDQRYDATRQTIGALLSTTSPKIEVPEWQRSYSWTTTQVETFWQDLTAFGDQYPDKTITGQEYFLGSIVLVTGGPMNLLLDGQQRLATSTILLSVLRDARKLHKADSATRLQNKYISDFDDQSNTTTHVLTLNRYDRDFFRGEVQDEPANPPKRPKAELKSHGLIRKAREYFAARVEECYKDLGGGEPAFQWNIRIAQVLCDHMSVVSVTSTDDDNAAAVFETLNDRGIGLSTPDLLRNLLLRRAEGPDQRERIVSAWKTILDIDDEASVDDFLRHYWVSHRGDVKSRKLYREIKVKVLEEGIDSLELSLDLAENAPLYADIIRAREDDEEMRQLLVGLRALAAKSVYPALLSGYSAAAHIEAEIAEAAKAKAAKGESEESGKGGGDVKNGEKGKEKSSQEKLRALAHALTALFVRYNVIGGRETTVMEKTIYEVAAQLRKDQDFDAAISTLAALAPEPGDFVTRFSRVSVSRIATARYLLREIEHAKRETAEVSVSGTNKVHVEHIYPQTPEKAKWPNHAAMINRLGNLTLLGKRFNTSIKNGDFPTKKDKAYKSSDILMTKELVDYDTWDADAVAKRQDELSTWVLKIWGFPGEEITKQPPTGGDGATTASDPDDPEQLPETPEVEPASPKPEVLKPAVEQEVPVVKKEESAKPPDSPAETETASAAGEPDPEQLPEFPTG
jgi:hypothetical protein